MVDSGGKSHGEYFQGESDGGPRAFGHKRQLFQHRSNVLEGANRVPACVPEHWHPYEQDAGHQPCSVQPSVAVRRTDPISRDAWTDGGSERTVGLRELPQEDRGISTWEERI